MTDLVEELGLPARILPPIRHAGEPLGPLLDDVRAATGLAADARVTLVGSHDTASAVVAVPAEDDDAAWISCGTWGLVGIEVDAPIRTEASRLANFTNEGGVDGRVRFLHNVTGLWLLQESIRTWEHGGTRVDLDELLRAAAALPAGGPRIDPDDAAFFPPGDMPGRIATAVARSDGAVAANRLDGREPAGRAALVRCILDSLAAAFADSVAEAARLSGRSVRVVHIVGGGSRNEPLVPADCRRVRAPGRRRAGRGDVDRQPPRPGPRARADRGRPRRRSGRSSGRPSRSAATSRGRGRMRG